MSKESNKRKRKIAKKANKPANKVYAAMHNKAHMTTVATDRNGSCKLVNAWEFITMINKEIGLCQQNGEHQEINLYHMPAVQRCLSAVSMINNFDEDIIFLYVSKKFRYLTMERLTTDYQKKEASDFKTSYDAELNRCIPTDQEMNRTDNLRHKIVEKAPDLVGGLFVPSRMALVILKQTENALRSLYKESGQENLILAFKSTKSVIDMYEDINPLTSVVFISIDDEADREKFMQIGLNYNLQIVVQNSCMFEISKRLCQDITEKV